jgi:hypothetical protein
MSATIAAPAVNTLSEAPRTSRVSITTLTPDAAYPTGGYPVTPQQLGLQQVTAAVAHVSGGAANNGAVQASYNAATGKVQLWASSGVSPVGLVEAGAVNLSGLTVTILAFGV